MIFVGIFCLHINFRDVLLEYQMTDICDFRYGKTTCKTRFLLNNINSWTPINKLLFCYIKFLLHSKEKRKTRSWICAVPKCRTAQNSSNLYRFCKKKIVSYSFIFLFLSSKTFTHATYKKSQGWHASILKYLREMLTLL